jgi:hypothetical protein
MTKTYLPKNSRILLDGFDVPTRQPFDLGVEHPMDYRFRKGSFAIIVLAGCNSIACTSFDIIAWQDSDLFEAIEIEKLFANKILHNWRQSIQFHKLNAKPMAR